MLKSQKKPLNIAQPALVITAIATGLIFSIHQEQSQQVATIVTPQPTPLVVSTVPPPVRQEKVSRGDERKNRIIDAINKNLAGNLGEIFYLAGKTYSVNPMMLAAICRHETANWTSNLAVKHNNPGGINWSNRWVGKYAKTGRYVSFPDKSTGIHEFAHLIKDVYIDAGHNSLDLIKLKYAPDSDYQNGKFGMSNNIWLPNVERIYQTILEEAEI